MSSVKLSLEKRQLLSIEIRELMSMVSLLKQKVSVF